jgi:hypothetical protein
LEVHRTTVAPLVVNAPLRTTPGAYGSNVAVTVVSLFTVTVHGLVEQPPPEKPPKLDPAAWVAVRTTWVPFITVSVQLEPQFMLPSPLTTVPEPAPARETVRVDALFVNDPFISKMLQHVLPLEPTAEIHQVSNPVELLNATPGYPA